MYTHPKRNARSRWKHNIHNAHKVTARILLNKFELISGRQKRRLVQQSSISARSQQNLRKPSQQQWSGLWCVLQIIISVLLWCEEFRKQIIFPVLLWCEEFRKQIMISVLLWCVQCLIVALWCRGGPNKCPMAISDFVLLHNKAAEGLVKPNRVGYDIYSDIADVKGLFSKYCKQYEKRLSSMVPTFRVVPAGDGEALTTVSIPGFVVDARVKKKTFAPMDVYMQFIER